MIEIQALRTALSEILDQWESTALSAAEVHAAAESLTARWAWQVCSRDEPGSIVNEVLAQLDVLNQQLIIADDIPEIRAFLLTPAGAETAAWRRWECYWNQIDYGARAEQLREEPAYAV